MRPIAIFLLGTIVNLPTTGSASDLRLISKEPDPRVAFANLKHHVQRGRQSAGGYYECYPSSSGNSDIESDCSLFRTLCAQHQGGKGKLPGGGYSCHIAPSASSNVPSGLKRLSN